jgi:hypothetical protein
MWGDPDLAKVMEDGGVTLTKWVPAPPVALLPVDVWMISFVHIPFNKLKSWSGSAHYGCLGIAFTASFERRVGIKRVHYYQYPTLEKDPAVIAYNNAVSAKDPNIQNIADGLSGYRKPARLWPEINGLFAMLKVSGGPGGTSVEKLTYSRYEINYSFEAEQEARKVMAEQARDLPFEETDVLAIIVPDENARKTVNSFLSNEWKACPNVLVYPQ